MRAGALGRGRVMVKVRHGLVHVTLDVPNDARLLAWGTTAHQPLTGHVTFSETGGRTACETLAREAGECVGRGLYSQVMIATNGRLSSENWHCRCSDEYRQH